jgi:hypothetical protein
MAVHYGSVLTPVTRRAMRAMPPFAPLPTAPGMARGHVRATLAQWGLGELADTTEMIASELTANAVNASAALHAADSVPVIRLCLITDGETLVIECAGTTPSASPRYGRPPNLPRPGAAWPSSIPSRAGRVATRPPRPLSVARPLSRPPSVGVRAKPTVPRTAPTLRFPSAMRPWTPQHSGLRRYKLTHDGTNENSPPAARQRS